MVVGLGWSERKQSFRAPTGAWAGTLAIGLRERPAAREQDLAEPGVSPTAIRELFESPDRV
jgi:hypothetical protein